MPTLSGSYLNSAVNALRILAQQDMAGRGQAPTAKTVAKVGPVTQTQATGMMLSIETAEKTFGADSFLMRTARGLADHVEVRIASIPQDKAAFKAEALKAYTATQNGDAGFMAALKDGRITVQTVDEVPELNLQHSVNFTLWKDGFSQGSGGYTPGGMDHALWDKMGETRVQHYSEMNGVTFYLWYDRAG